MARRNRSQNGGRVTISRFGRILRQRMRSLVAKNAVDAEVSRELSFHLDALIAERVADGLSPDAARRAARLALGNLPALEDECRDQRRVGWFHDFLQDVDYGIRILRKTPVLTAIAAASLALGVGANAATLGVVDAVFLGSMPFPDSDRLAIIRTFAFDSPGQKTHASFAEYVAITDASRAFASMGASISDQADFGAEAGGAPVERLNGQLFTPSLFVTLGVRPLLGRVFTEENPTGVVISHGLWLRRWGGDPAILGKTVRLNGVTAPIIGVMPPEFLYPNERAQYWLALQVRRQATLESARYYAVTARLAPGVTRRQADADVQRVAAQLEADAPHRNKGRGLAIETLREAWYGWTVAPLATLQGAVLLILLIGCTNVAGLLLARGTTRAPEMGLRIALGAGRERIIRQLLTESVVLSLAAGVLALLVTWWGLRAVTAMVPLPGGARIPEITLGVRALVMVIVLALATGVLFGIWPALAASRSDLASTFKDSERGSSTPHGSFRVRSALVAVQIALALVLLVGTGLLMNSFLRLNTRELNFEPRGVLTFSYRIPASRYLHPIGLHKGYPYYEIAPPPTQMIERVYERLRQLPGAEGVAGISHFPAGSILVPRAELSRVSQAAGSATASSREVVYFFVTPSTFAVLKTPIVRGREFDGRDTASAPWGAVVNETLARQTWPGEDPLGKELVLDIVPEERPRQVIGVVGDIPLGRAQVDPPPIVYLSYLQQSTRTRGPSPNAGGQMTFLVRSATRPGILVPEARRVVAEIDPERPLADVFPMDALLDISLTPRQAIVSVLGVFAFAATVLAAIGIYGVMSYSVAQRAREIGIRVALGAGAGQVVMLIGGHALFLVGIGLTIGLTVALVLTRLIASQLWGVSPTDPMTFGIVSMLLLLVALLACVIPLRQGLRVDPRSAIRLG